MRRQCYDVMFTMQNIFSKLIFPKLGAMMVQISLLSFKIFILSLFNNLMIQIIFYKVVINSYYILKKKEYIFMKSDTIFFF